VSLRRPTRWIGWETGFLHVLPQSAESGGWLRARCFGRERSSVGTKYILFVKINVVCTVLARSRTALL
jgi:hypothetical protein